MLSQGNQVAATLAPASGTNCPQPKGSVALTVCDAPSIFTTVSAFCTDSQNSSPSKSL